MKSTQYIAPTSYPVSLADLKLHLKIDAGTMSDAITQTQSIVPGSHAVTSGFSLIGATVMPTADDVLVTVSAGSCGTGGSVDVKIQESETGTGDWTDWSGGSFTGITEANDNAIYEKNYTGTKAIRVVAQVLTAACEFGVTVSQYEPISDEDSLLERILAGATNRVEQLTRRQLMTATWDYWIDEWPCGDAIVLPYGNLQTVTSVKWKDSAGAETTLTPASDYIVETNGSECGRIVLPFGGIWPSGTLYPSSPICIRFVCGYSSVPDDLKIAVLFVAESIWRRGADEAKYKNLIDFYTANYRLYDEF